MMGILMGPVSLTIKSLPEEIKQHFPQSWHFISLVTNYRTVDLYFEQKQELVDFMIAVNYLTNRINPDYPALISRKLLGIMILKLRLASIAKKCFLGRSIACLLLKSLYLVGMKLPAAKTC